MIPGPWPGFCYSTDDMQAKFIPLVDYRYYNLIGRGARSVSML